MGYRWDANAQAYIFPSLAFKKVDGPMAEYQKDRGKSIQTDKAKRERRKAGDERALAVQIEEPVSLRGTGQAEGHRCTE